MDEAETSSLVASNVIRCPRCGYDQQGAVSPWSEQCPLDGRCTECGLDFEWAQLIVPYKFAPKWLVEFAATRIRLPWCVVQTFVRSFRPFKFWSRVRMSHPIHARRLVGYVLVMLGLIVLPYVVVQSATAIYVRYKVGQDVARIPQAAAAQAQTLKAWLQSPQRQALNPEESEADRQRLTRFIATLQQQASGPPPRVDQSYFAAVIEVVFCPLASASWGAITDPTGTFGSARYPAPADLYEVASIYQASGSWLTPTPGIGAVAPRVFIDQLIAAMLPAIGCLAFTVTVLAMLPASLALLPVSRRRAKVRWAHIARVAAYSPFIPACVVLVCSVLGGLSLVTGTQDWAEAMTEWGITTLVPLLWCVLWWWAAIRQYMLIPHAFFTSLTLTIMCGLILFAVVFYTVVGFPPYS